MRTKKVFKFPEQTTEPMSKIIPDTKDASKDYWIPTIEARRQYGIGKLDIDLTNSKPNEIVYCPHVDSPLMKGK